jgi:hypothetical protein
MVEVHNGTRSRSVDGKREYYPEPNFTFPENYPANIWRADLKNWPGLPQLEWAGPVLEPGTTRPT